MVHYTAYEVFIQLHKQQLVSSGIPSHFWEIVFQKVSTQLFDAGNIFALLQVDYEDAEKSEYDPVWQLQIKTEDGIKASDPNQIYLVDHAWTFRINDARKQLTEHDSLRERMADVIGLNSRIEKHQLVDEIFETMWKYVNFYSIDNAENVEGSMPVWYIMDELGSAIQHSEQPNFRAVPFIYIPEQVTYCLIYPLQDVRYGEIITRDFVEGCEDSIRSALSLPWLAKSFIDIDFTQIEPCTDYFLSGHIKESLPILTQLIKSMPKKAKYNVYSEYSLIHEHLKNERFEIVENVKDADILWYTKHFKNFEELADTPEKFVNQFPFEYVLTIKDLLAVISRRKATVDMVCIPTTYNLATELDKFVSYYEYRELQGLDNHWIIKPFNLARGLDTHITKNLKYILRLPMTGPKIAQKYIENPVLFARPECEGKVKFDLRFVLLLKRAKPLEVYAYKNFFLRFANKPFELQDFEEYEKHFTVMNYTETADLKQMLCEEFKTNWQQQYENISWESVENSIFKILRDVFECATLKDPPCGIAESPQSRALYAADIMLEWSNSNEIQPKLLEINWTPDCKRACEYYPDFYNNIFKLLFLDEDNHVFKLL